MPGSALAARMTSREGLVRRAFRNDQHHRRGGDQGHRRQVLDRIVGDLHQQRDQRNIVRLCDHEVIAGVVERAGFRQAQRGAGAGLVVGDDLPAVHFGQLGAHQATDEIRAAAGRGGNDHADRLGGIALGLRHAGGGSQDEKGEMAANHWVSRG